MSAKCVNTFFISPIL